MNIGIVCYASLGGSGVVATELAHALASRGHEVHLISSDEPFRWRAGVPRLSFERVETPAVLETLRRIGVGYAQGFLCGRPTPMAVFPHRK